MAIQIKGINTELLLYKTQLERKVPFSDRMVERVHRVMDKANNLPYPATVLGKVRETMLTAEGFGLSAVALAANAKEMSTRKKELMKATGYSSEEVAIDINELASLRNSRKNVKVFGDDIRYSAQIKKEWLTSIETIFGTADLQALDSFECLSSLKAIYGDLNLAQVKGANVDLSGLHLQMVYGDIHAEQVKSTEGLEDLLTVGGTIYYQDKAYKLAEFQQLFGTEKERQM